jgi:hypothetical protein
MSLMLVVDQLEEAQELGMRAAPHLIQCNLHHTLPEHYSNEGIEKYENRTSK